MLKRIKTLLNKDFTYSIRESALVYSLVGILLMVIIVRFFVITALDEPNILIAVDQSVPEVTVNKLEEYVEIEHVTNFEELQKRVLEYDDVSGIYFNGKKHVVLSEGNEEGIERKLPGMLLNYVLSENTSTEFSTSFFKREQFPIIDYLALFMIIGIYQIGGLFIGLSIVDDRQSGSIKALIITPIKTIEYIIGKSILGSSVVVILSLIAASILLGPSTINYPLLTIGVIVSLGITIFVGFLVGIISKNYVTANALYKPLGTFITLIPAAALFIPENLKYLLYIFPNYWTFEVFYRMFIKTDLPIIPMILIAMIFSLATIGVLVMWFGRKLRLTIH